MKRPLAAIAGTGLILAGAGAYAQPAKTSPLDDPKFCKALDTFAAAPPRDRWVTFFWPAPSEDEIDMYAAMGGKPMDRRAHGLYEAYGQATHYIELSDLGTRLASCPSAKAGRVRVEASQAACDGRPSPQACLRIARPSP